MVSVAQKARWCQRFLERIEKARKKGDKHAVSRISGYWRVPVKSAYDWLYKWDGSWQSLAAKSHRPHHHPNAHTQTEIQLMIRVTRECGFLAPLLMYQELLERGYTRSYGGFKRFFRKRFASPTAPLVRPKKPEIYDGGTYPGERVQIDIKHVPKACRYGEKLYQYTLVDEYSRWCYREIHRELNDYVAGIFLRNAVKIAPFKIKEAQTDNGHEFTNALWGQKREELSHFEKSLKELSIDTVSQLEVFEKHEQSLAYMGFAKCFSYNSYCESVLVSQRHAVFEHRNLPVIVYFISGQFPRGDREQVGKKGAAQFLERNAV